MLPGTADRRLSRGVLEQFSAACSYETCSERCTGACKVAATAHRPAAFWPIESGRADTETRWQPSPVPWPSSPVSWGRAQPTGWPCRPVNIAGASQMQSKEQCANSAALSCHRPPLPPPLQAAARRGRPLAAASLQPPAATWWSLRPRRAAAARRAAPRRRGLAA